MRGLTGHKIDEIARLNLVERYNHLVEYALGLGMHVRYVKRFRSQAAGERALHRLMAEVTIVQVRLEPEAPTE